MRPRRKIEDECEKCGAKPGSPCVTARMSPLSPRMFHLSGRPFTWVKFGNIEYMVDGTSPARRFD